MAIDKIGIRFGICRNRGCEAYMLPAFAIRDSQSKIENSQGA